MRELTDVIDSEVMSRFGGTKVGQFEYEFMDEFMGIYGAKYAIASTSGTVSLYIAIGICGKPVRNRSPSDRYKFGNEVLRELTDVIDSGVMSRFGGTKVGQFEYEFAEIYGAKCGIASASSTSSLHIATGMLNP